MKASRVRRFGLVDVPGCAHGASSPGRSDRHVSDHRAVGVTRPPPGSQSARLRSSVASPLFGISAEPGPCEVSGHEAADSPKEQTTRQTPSASHPRQPLADVRGGGMQASSVRRCEPVDLPRCVRSVSSPGQSDRHVSGCGRARAWRRKAHVGRAGRQQSLPPSPAEMRRHRSSTCSNDRHGASRDSSRWRCDAPLGHVAEVRLHGSGLYASPALPTVRVGRPRRWRR